MNTNIKIYAIFRSILFKKFYSGLTEETSFNQLIYTLTIMQFFVGQEPTKQNPIQEIEHNVL